MPEKRRTRMKSGQAKAQRATAQTTLKDLFQRTNSGTVSTDKAQGLDPECTDPVAPSPQTANPLPPSQPSKPLKPKASSVPDEPRDAVINLDDTEVIDITDASSPIMIDLSTEPPLSSAHQLSPRSEFSHATPPPRPPSPIALDIHYCETDTSLPYAEAREYTHPHKPSKNKEFNKRTPGLGDVAPLPSSYSQHVRGSQHSYTSDQVASKRSVFPGFLPSNEESLDFLKKCQQLDDTLSTPLDHIHRPSTPQRCEEYLQSLGRDNTESHPAFARISLHREKTPLRHAEMWTRRFRPRRANEVLGNEQQAIYLRDWLSALELHLRDRQPGVPVSKGATASENNEKSTMKRVDPVKRPRVTRAVTRKRGNKRRRVDSDDDLNDFVVFSDADEEQADDPPEDSEDEFASCRRALTRLHRRNATDTHEATSITSTIAATETDRTSSQLQEPTRTNFADNLTNTLLITGPPGCGKSAAVYACAEELGWEIFEVYPGIGRRNGANLDHLVGDVGRNHIVQTVHRDGPMKTTKSDVKETKGLRGYLAKGKTGRFAKPQVEKQPISVEVDGPTDELRLLPPEQESEEAVISGMCPAESDGLRTIVRQSLVLLEEVDILFKEDAGFWPAVIDFIECCQRPVVMTCNDPGLVPLCELPLQKVLVFEPCPSPVAATFLQCLSLKEGCVVPHEDLMVLYEKTDGMDGIDIPEGPLYPRTEPLPLPDLRRSITQLQMMCAGARHGSRSEMHQGDEAGGHVRRSGRPISAECRYTPVGSTAEREWWRKMKGHSELMSHVDAQLCRGPMARRETLSMGLEDGSEEEERGYVVLSTGGWDEEGREGLVYYQQDELIAEEAIQCSRGVHEECAATGPMEASINPAARLTREDAGGFRARVEYQTRMGEALQGVVGPPAPLMPQNSVFLDYIPWVRYMVTVDDVLERRAMEEGSGRWTRNSMRTRHARTVGASEAQRALLARGGLGEEDY